MQEREREGEGERERGRPTQLSISLRDGALSRSEITVKIRRDVARAVLENIHKALA